MKFPELKRKFRTAVLSGLAALGLMTGGCGRTPDTQVVIDNDKTFINVGFGEWSDWSYRQYACLENDSNRVHYQTWLAQLDSFKNASLLEKTAAVNDLVNKTVIYAEDSTIYGVREYFASGAQTVLKGVGDCEDFAIAKLYALQYLGVPENRMALMGVATDSASKSMNHGVLAVDTSAANDWTNCVILDDDEYLLGVLKTGGLRTLGQTGYKPFYLIDELEIRACRLKTLKPPAP